MRARYRQTYFEQDLEEELTMSAFMNIPERKVTPKTLYRFQMPGYKTMPSGVLLNINYLTDSN